MKPIINVVIGVIFGIGLIVSGMADPAKVLNFLDVAGTWDPSLAFVMAGAIAVAAPGYALVLRRAAPLQDTVFSLPATSPVDGRLIAGAAVFGLGWGLVGLCPGPAIVSLTIGSPGIFAFVGAMLAGIIAAAYLRKSAAVDPSASDKQSR
jgi:uncharacterized membrane protein YedE/YeeE